MEPITLDQIIQRQVFAHEQVANLMAQVRKNWKAMGWRKRLITRIAWVLGVSIDFK
jgi:hypothetical protein